jgi:hypothetical protein
MKSPSADGSVPVPRRYVSEAELSVYLGVSKRSLQGWRLRGIGVPWKKISGAVRYDLKAVDEYIQACPGGGAAQGTPTP